MDPDTWPRKALKTIVTGSNPRVRPRKTRLESVRNDLKVRGLKASLAQNRIAWCWALNPKNRCGRDNEVEQSLGTGHSARLNRGVSKYITTFLLKSCDFGKTRISNTLTNNIQTTISLPFYR